MTSPIHQLSDRLLLLCMVVASILFLACSSCHAFTFQTTYSSCYAQPKSCMAKRPRQHRTSLHMSSDSLPSTSTTTSNIPSTIQATLPKTHDRTTAQQMVRQTLCPPNEERDRNTAGMEAYDNDSVAGRGQAITNNDPRSEYTYGEFPLGSFDLLVDRALDFVQDEDRTSTTMVDLGSGCGRLVFYAALTREGGEKGSSSSSPSHHESKSWNVHGVEIGTQLHSLAVNSLHRGVEQGWFEKSTTNDGSNSVKEQENHGSGTGSSSQTIAFHNGNALLVDDPYYEHANNNNIQSLLSQTNILFAYSTVWETNTLEPFQPELQAMILAPKWSTTLASLCSNGCVAVTTDRALNPEDGWRLVDRMDVENPSVWGSVGYISVLEK
mmetsp:Transcript_24227/g.52258  ORF Transcript_24227/g.52258 Transcript_24227/m.52258 type:complete len:381 (+) Transcript_24227:123-1265(+)